MRHKTIISTSIKLFFSLYLSFHLLPKHILNTLHQDVIHMERWDPTEIIAQPFPIQTLQYFVFIVACCVVFIFNVITVIFNRMTTVQNQQQHQYYFVESISKYISLQCILMVLTYLCMFLAGASLSSSQHNQSHSSRSIHYHTILSCIYLSLLSFGYFHCQLPTILWRRTSSKGINRNNIIIRITIEVLIYTFFGSNTLFIQDDDDEGGGEEENIQNDNEEEKEQQQQQQQQHQEDNNNSKDTENGYNNEESTNRFIMYSTIFVTIPFQILHILDHGEQLQRWPIPIIFGATVGHCIGCIIGFVVCCKKWCLKMREDKKIQ